MQLSNVNTEQGRCGVLLLVIPDSQYHAHVAYAHNTGNCMPFFSFVKLLKCGTINVPGVSPSSMGTGIA